MATSTLVQRPRQTYQQPPYTPPSSITPPSSLIKVSSARQVGYVPAALRPTEMPVRVKRPVTPPRSANNSLDSSATFSSDSLPTTPIDEAGSVTGPPEGLLSRVVSDEWNQELELVSGAPTRDHWKPDSAASSCGTSSCNTVFTFFSRRHHCRRCGDIYCLTHTSRTVPLDHYARFHPAGSWERACDKCREDYIVWRDTRSSRASSRAGSGTATPVTELPPSSDAFGIPQKPKQTPVVPGNESVAGDWHWSTF